MTWVKICGITNLEDALMAVDAGADALGFVFYDKSPRRADPQVTGEIVSKLPKNIEKVGVFVDVDADYIRDVVSATGLTAAQVHWKKSLGPIWGRTDAAAANIGVPKLIPVIAGNDLKNSGDFLDPAVREKIFAFLLDSNGAVGGTGMTFDWQTSQCTVQYLGSVSRVIVAGGLTPTNVSEAMRILKPWGVDVASGVEARPGKKDPDKVRKFISAVRKADKQN
jgi:phosphoribosylanthranilate isomerase